MTGTTRGQLFCSHNALQRRAVEFVKESLVFTGEDSPTANHVLSVMGAFAEFERSFISERQSRDGIALTKQRGGYKGQEKTSHRYGLPIWSSRGRLVFPGSGVMAQVAQA
ncbi:recombinase family protein [Arthrobacter sp. ISL-65]|nr:recombinase family protein [Arthrobacter sp. ISL-65]